MKSILKLSLFIFFLVGTLHSFAQKKTQNFSVSRVIKAPATAVWKVVGEDFGAVANSHPGIISSEYISGSLEGGEGAERVCYLNEKKTKYTQEKQVEYNPEDYRFKAQVFRVDGIPLDADVTYAIYQVAPMDENTSKLTITMAFRTKPAFMGSLAKGRFKKTIADYALAVEHHVLTGEKVNKDNFKEIKKQYPSR